MEKEKKIIVADDEPLITTLVADFLRASGYKPLVAADGSAALKLFSENPDTALVILDIMMPELNGWETCREIRKISDVPIIFLTARSEEFDQLTSFESGADEYVTKPFSPAVLVKRVDALIRRASGNDMPNHNRGISIDEEAYTAYLGGEQLSLTLKEFELLRYLALNKGHVLTRDQLLNNVWGYDYMGDSRTVDSHIARLRTKLGEYGDSHLKTIYGLGYKLEL